MKNKCFKDSSIQQIKSRLRYIKFCGEIGCQALDRHPEQSRRIPLGFAVVNDWRRLESYVTFSIGGDL
jgi:hypothetical protein